MKKSFLPFLLLAACVVGSSALADIQAPPGMRYNAVRKFGRAVSNLLYGPTELPATLMRTTDRSASEFAHGVTAGTGRSFARVGWGFFELVTFPFKTYKGSYRTPFRKSIYFNPIRGYEEFPPELGFLSSSHYVRDTRF